MLVKALVSFAGAVTMNTGDTADIDEKTAVSLISCGLAEEVKEKAGESNGAVGNNSGKSKKGSKN